MRLHFESVGEGFPIIILHGLFGSSDNWQGFARRLQSQYRALLPDQRNHGQSPHSEQMSYPLMASDIRELMDEQRIPRAHVIGHSMGGKTAMQLALDFPDLVRSLISVDIAPRQYESRHDAFMDALLGLDFPSFKTRQEIEIALAPFIPDLQVRRFLLKGVARDETNGFRWRMGLKEIADNYENISAAVSSSSTYSGPALFVRGEISSYTGKSDEAHILQMFPKAEFACIPRASHWVHVDNPADFGRVVEGFLASQ